MGIGNGRRQADFLKVDQKGRGNLEGRENNAHDAEFSVVGRQMEGAVDIGLDAGTFEHLLKTARNKGHDLRDRASFSRDQRHDRPRRAGRSLALP